MMHDPVGHAGFLSVCYNIVTVHGVGISARSAAVVSG
jgi:hypothetical protein